MSDERPLLDVELLHTPAPPPPEPLASEQPKPRWRPRWVHEFLIGWRETRAALRKSAPFRITHH